VVWGLLADLLLWHHPPNTASLLGAGLVCSSSFLIVLSEQLSARDSREGGVVCSLATPGGSKAKQSGSALVEMEAVAGPFRVQADGLNRQHLELDLAGCDSSRLSRTQAVVDVGPAGEQAEEVDERAPLLGAPLGLPAAGIAAFAQLVM